MEPASAQLAPNEWRQAAPREKMPGHHGEDEGDGRHHDREGPRDAESARDHDGCTAKSHKKQPEEHREPPAGGASGQDRLDRLENLVQLAPRDRQIRVEVARSESHATLYIEGRRRGIARDGPLTGGSASAAFWLLAVVLVAAGVILALLLAPVPGRIARRRQHPNALAINVCGWLGLLFAPCWTRPRLTQMGAPSVLLMAGDDLVAASANEANSDELLVRAEIIEALDCGRQGELLLDGPGDSGVEHDFVRVVKVDVLDVESVSDKIAKRCVQGRTDVAVVTALELGEDQL